METKSQTLAEIFEPIILLVCKLRRADSRKISLDFVYVRKAILYAWEQVDRRSGESGQDLLIQKVRPLIEHFLDFVVGEITWAHASRWQIERAQILPNLPSEFAATATIKSVLGDPNHGKQVRELFAVLASFGWLKGRIMTAELAVKFSERAEDESEVLCAQAYEFTDSRDFAAPVAGRIGKWILLASLAIGILVGANYFIFRVVAGDLLAIVELVKGKGGF